MKQTIGIARRVRVALFLSAIAFVPSVSNGDSSYEDRMRLRQEQKAQQERIRRREEEAKRRIMAGQYEAARELEEVSPALQQCREALSFATQTAKSWSDQRDGAFPPALMEQGRRYRSRVATVEKQYRDCAAMHRSSNYVIDEVRGRIAALKATADAVAREGGQLCFAILNLYADEGRENLRGVDDDLKSASDGVSQIRGTLQQMAERELKAANKRMDDLRKEGSTAGQKKHRKQYETDAKKFLLKQMQDDAEEQKRREARQAAEEARRKAENEQREAKSKLEKSLHELERKHSELSGRRENCESALARALSGLNDWDYWYKANKRSWNDSLHRVQAELGTIESLKADVKAFCSTVSELENANAPLAGAPEKQGDRETAEKRGAKKPRTTGSRAPCFSWSPWEESDGSDATVEN